MLRTSIRLAIRGLGRNWTRILWRCWTDHTTYQPQRHGNLQRHLAAKQG